MSVMNRIILLSILLFMVSSFINSAHGQEPTNLQIQIDDLKERITNLENKDPVTTWVPIIISSITAIVTIIALLLNKQSYDINTRSIREKSAMDTLLIEKNYQDEIRALIRSDLSKESIANNATDTLKKLDQIAYFIHHSMDPAPLSNRFEQFFLYGSTLYHWLIDLEFKNRPDFANDLKNNYVDFFQYLKEHNINNDIDDVQRLSKLHYEMIGNPKIHFHDQPLCDKDKVGSDDCDKYNHDIYKSGKCDIVEWGTRKEKCRCIHHVKDKKNWLGELI